MHRVRHIAKRIENQIIQVREQELGGFRNGAEIGKVRRAAETKAEHTHVSVLRWNRHDPRSNHFKWPVDRMQSDLRDGADRWRFFKNIRESSLQGGDGFRGCINRQRRFLPQIKWAYVVKAENVIRVGMRE